MGFHLLGVRLPWARGELNTPLNTHRDLKWHFCQGSSLHAQKLDVIWEARLFPKFHSYFHGTGGLIREIRQQNTICLLLFSHSVVSDSLQPHGLQHVRLSCPSYPGACSNSCPWSRWYHPIILYSVVHFFSCLQSFPASGSFLNKSALRMRWPKYWSFSFISSLQWIFRIDFL